MNKKLLEQAQALDQKTKTALNSPAAAMLPASMRNAWLELSALAVTLSGAVDALKAELDAVKGGK